MAVIGRKDVSYTFDRGTCLLVYQNHHNPMKSVDSASIYMVGFCKQIVQRFYSGIRAKGSKPGKNQSRAKRGTGKKRLARKDFCGLLLRLTQTDEEAVKESEKEYIGMVKICYEGAHRSKQERPGEDVVGNKRGTAWIKEPHAFAKISVEVGDALDGTPRKKSRTARDLVLVWKATWKRQPRRTRGELEEQDLNN
ncbi:hypothetical protein Tco_0861920 [Tanacetum coccineum]